MGMVRAWMGMLFFAGMTMAGQTTEVNSRDLGGQALRFFKTYCYRCHGQDGSMEGGLNYVLDRRQLVNRRKITRGKPDKSRLFLRLLDREDPMLPQGEKLRPEKADLELIRRWIEAGAPAAIPTSPRPFLSLDDVARAIHNDLDRMPTRQRRFARYFTLTHLHNAGLPAEELQSYRQAVSRLINSLSWGQRVVLPQTVDPSKTILRIDLRDYQWNEETWKTLLARHPYGIVGSSAAARSCAERTHCRLPFLRGDWFVALASRPPLYHELLQLPATEKDLEKMLRLDSAENIRQERVARAGFNGSGVSRNNRLIERHESGATVFWKSYDFAGNTGRQNLFAHPLVPPGDFLKALEQFPHLAKELGPLRVEGGTVQRQVFVDAFGDLVQALRLGTYLVPHNAALRQLLRRGRNLLAKGDAGGALTIFAEAAVRDPGNPLAHAGRGDALKSQGNLAGAILAYTEALRLDPLSATFFNNRGLIHQRQGDHERALADFDAALRLQPNLAVAYHNRGAALFALGKVKKALDDYTEALRLQPQSPLTFNNRGFVYLDQGEKDRALADFDQALRLQPRFAAAFNNRGLVFLGKHQFDRALGDFSAALQIDPAFARAYFNRAVVLERLGDNDRARADRKKARDIDPNLE